MLNLNPDYIALKVTDDSMAPKFISDSTVIGKKGLLMKLIKF